jgi:AraC-like DNA-binding protein
MVATSRTQSGGRRLFSADGLSAARHRSEATANIFASMHLQLAADDPVLGRGALCEDTKGTIGHCEVPASEMRSTWPAASGPREADICLWLIERGTLTVEQNNGIQTRFGPGSALLCDVAQAMRGRWDRARFSFVRPARQRLVQLIGHVPAARARSIEAVDHLALAPFLASQLGTLANHGVALGSDELEAVLAGIFQTAEGLLGAVYMSGLEQGVDRLQLVHRYIQSNLHRHDLSVVDIARDTGLSRAQLYRLFSSQDMSVHATLREMRLLKSLSYLHQPKSGQLSIGAIAYACGFSDQAVFSKLFRQRFGMPAREARQRMELERPADVSRATRGMPSARVGA